MIDNERDDTSDDITVAYKPNGTVTWNGEFLTHLEAMMRIQSMQYAGFQRMYRHAFTATESAFATGTPIPPSIAANDC